MESTHPRPALGRGNTTSMLRDPRRATWAPKAVVSRSSSWQSHRETPTPPSQPWQSHVTSNRHPPPLPNLQNILPHLTRTPSASSSRSASYRHTMVPPPVPRSFSSSASLRSVHPQRSSSLKRWDPRMRKPSGWDALRCDPELFHPSGDCMIHLYAEGHSRRGASMCVPMLRLYELRCGRMFAQCRIQETETSNQDLSGKSRAFNIYIPAPSNYLRDEALAWHITTRNFIAFAFLKPLVGSHLGKALVSLRERLQLFRDDHVDNQSDMLAYMNRIGYLKIGHNPEYALAVLYYAEAFKIQDLFIDAFAHCVGMYAVLNTSSEYEHISRVTKLSITRASLEMGLHLDRASKSLSNFLEEELSASYVGLGSAARAHLDRFRTFLHQYHVEKFGYWPPIEGSQFPKPLYRSMYFDFQGLYTYLVDENSTDSMQAEMVPTGGICVLQNVQGFDSRNNFAALRHPLPLLPDTSFMTKTQSRRASWSLNITGATSRGGRNNSARTALCAAANTADLSVLDCALVKAYRMYERDSVALKEDLSLQDARKVRWILVYAIYQVLISATRAPKEVRDVEGPSYPLCVDVSGSIPWEPNFRGAVPTLGRLSRRPSTRTSKSMPNTRPSSSHSRSGAPLGRLTNSSSLDVNGMPVSASDTNKSLPFTPDHGIRPDCETDPTYFGKSRSQSSASLKSLAHTSEKSSANAAHTSGTSTPNLFRNASSRSMRALSFNHNTSDSGTSTPPLRRDLSKRSIKALSIASFGSRRDSIVLPQPQSSFREIIVKGYGNGLNEAVTTETRDGSEQCSRKDDDISSSTTVTGRPTPTTTRSADLIASATPLRPRLSTLIKRHSTPLFALIGASESEASAESETIVEREASQPDLTPEYIISPPANTSASDSTPKRTDSQTPLSSNVSAESDNEGASMIWTSRRGSASSQSSAGPSPITPQFSKAQQLRINILPAQSVQGSPPVSPIDATSSSVSIGQSQPVSPIEDLGTPKTYELGMSVKPPKVVKNPQKATENALSVTMNAPHARSTPELRDVGDLLAKLDQPMPTVVPVKKPKSILVRRAPASEDNISSVTDKAATIPVSPGPLSPKEEAAAKRREQEKKLKARALAQRDIKRKSVRYKF